MKGGRDFSVGSYYTSSSGIVCSTPLTWVFLSRELTDGAICYSLRCPVKARMPGMVAAGLITDGRETLSDDSYRSGGGICCRLKPARIGLGSGVKLLLVRPVFGRTTMAGQSPKSPGECYLQMRALRGRLYGPKDSHFFSTPERRQNLQLLLLYLYFFCLCKAFLDIAETLAELYCDTFSAVCR